jgi:hypothetical protein
MLQTLNSLAGFFGSFGDNLSQGFAWTTAHTCLLFHFNTLPFLVVLTYRILGLEATAQNKSMMVLKQASGNPQK